jgi:GTP-binding protein Era
MTEGFKSGFVTLVGRPNAGKSTLVNAAVGHKVAITSSTAQTTRHRFSAIVTTDDMQMILVDTPGLHKPHDALGEQLNLSAVKALEDVDVIAFLIDASQEVGRGDEWVANQVNAAHAPHKILVLTKVDIADKDMVAQQLASARRLGHWDDEIALSAKTGFNMEGFTDAVARLLPEGPKWFPDDMDTDQPFEVLIAEFIREKVLRNFRDEVPHSIGVAADSVEYDRDKDLYRIAATIYVEREGQKGIIIGKGGKAIKEVGVEARQDLEQLLGCHVFLDLHVKVRKNWRRDLNQIRRFGYGEGA